MTRRIGTASYSFQYSLALWELQNRPGPRMSIGEMLERAAKSGAQVIQIRSSVVDALAPRAANALASRAARLGLHLELLGGDARRSDFPRSIERAAELGVKAMGCTFGFRTRPGAIASYAEWMQYIEKTVVHLRQLAAAAERYDVKVGVEPHFDFTVDEIAAIIERVGSPYIGVLLDIGNPVATLDDPLEAARKLGPYTVATHIKDFRVDETPEGFELTMVPLGTGNIRVAEILEHLNVHAPPDVSFCVEIINGWHCSLPWLAPEFLAAFGDRTAAHVAATLRHIRSMTALPVNPSQEELAQMAPESRMQFECERVRENIEWMKRHVAPQPQERRTKHGDRR